MFTSPLKSGAMISCSGSIFTNGVFSHDRVFMLVDSDTGEFLSQRKLPRMALIGQKFVGADLEWSAPGMETVNLHRVFMRGLGGPLVEVRVWEKGDDQLRQCHEEGGAYSDWFSRFLSRKCKLVVQKRGKLKEKEIKNLSMHVALHDSSAIHLVTEESLLALQVDEPVEVTARRFRPNIVVRTGKEAFWEDSWDGQIVIIEGRHSQPFLVRKKTGRCQVPGINPITGERDNATKEGLRNRIFQVDGENEVLFGLYLFPLNQQGLIAVGDEVTF